MALLGRRRAKRSVKTLRIGHLLPGSGLIGLRKIEIPRCQSVQFPRVGKFLAVAARKHFEKLSAGIPKLRFDQLLDFRGFFAIGFCRVRLAGQIGNGGDGLGIAVHVAVDRRAVAAASADRTLHAVACVTLPKQAIGVAPLLFPRLVVFHEVRQQIDGELGVFIGQVARPDGVGGPKAILPWLAAATKPERRIIVEIFWVAQPAAFVKMMARRTVDRVILAAPADFRQKFGNDKTVWR